MATSGRYAFLSDIHFPYHCKKAWPLTLSILPELNLDGVILGGDIVDFEPISRFVRAPKKKTDLVPQLKIAKAELNRLRNTLHVPMVYMEGNHEYRMERYLHEKAPELADLPALGVPHLLDLDSSDISWLGRGQVLHLGKLDVLHGDEIKVSGLTPARSLYHKVSGNMLVGHHHRFDRHIQRLFGSAIHGVWVNGCLSGLNPDWLLFPQWHQGITLIDVCANGLFSVDQIMYLERGSKLCAMVHGQEYCTGGRVLKMAA